MQACHCASTCRKKFLGYSLVTPRTARRHRKIDEDLDNLAILSTNIPAIPAPILLPRRELESPSISASTQIIPSPESLLPDLLGADRGQQNSDDYDFERPQDLDFAMDNSLEIASDCGDSSDDGSQGFSGFLDSAGESEIEMPNNSLSHEESPQSPQTPSPGNTPPSSPSPDNSLDSETDETEDLATAFRENPAIRLLYLQTVVANIFDSRTVLACNTQLTDGLDLLDAAGVSLIESIKPATTLGTAKRRLGLEYDDYIERRPICTVCSRYYSLEDIKDLPSPSCKKPRCKGIAYRIKRSSDDPPIEKRVPAKILPYISLIQSLKRMLLRPSFVNNLVPFQTSHFDEKTRMYDIQDSPAYNSIEIGLKRVVDEDGNVQDIEASRGSRRLLTSCELGLGMTLNLDW